jgi:hypothetical protein
MSALAIAPVILRKQDGTLLDLDKLDLKELNNLIRDDDFKEQRKLIANAYNKKLAELAYAVLEL